MKRQWTVDELIDQWTLLPGEMERVETSKTDHNHLGFAILLKYFQVEGKFPRHKHEVPPVVIAHLAKQLGLSPTVYLQYDWHGRTIKQHRAEIRTILGFREGTLQDAEALTVWLTLEVVPREQQLERLSEAASQWYRSHKIEPPTPDRLERLVRSAVRSYEERVCVVIQSRLSPATQAALDALLTTTEAEEDGAGSDTSELSRSPLQVLRTDPGSLSLDSILTEIAKLDQIRQLELPQHLFQDVTPKLLDRYRQRVATEPPRELRRHAPPLRATLLAAFCWLRSQEIRDTLVDLLIDVVHRIGAKAEQKVDRAFLKDLKRVRGKTQILYSVAEAAVTQPDGTVREVIFPAASEQVLRALVKEFKASGSYDHQVQLVMRGSYSHHFRRMLPHILKALEFRSNNQVHRPVIRALTLLHKYADSEQYIYDSEEDIPVDGVVPKDWRDLVLQRNKRGQVRVNRINYELCVLQVLREKLRCKEIWVVGANRFRNPDDDLPQDFDMQRTLYYEALRQPLDADRFVADLQQALSSALEVLNRDLPTNPKVKIVVRNGKGSIALSPLDPLPEAVNVARLKAEVGQRWPMTGLLDILKEADLRIGFTDVFTSSATREHLDRATLQKRLLLCLYGLGTNTGLKRVSAGDHGESYRDLLYVRRRFLSKDQIRAAIARVVNAIFEARHTHIWGEGTTACASDGKKFGGDLAI